MVGIEMRVLVTGATGFVGGGVLKRLVLDDVFELRAAVRRESKSICHGVESVIVGDLSSETDWCKALENTDVIIHAAARVHVMNDSASDPLTEYRSVNVAGTLNLARQAAVAGVRRFIFLSSIKVNGEYTLNGKPFTANDIANPTDPYAVSKYEAECGLMKLAEETDLEVVIIRPVLVYGPGVMANFYSMMCWMYKGLPLPFGSIQNSRSLVGIDNLTDLIITCITHRKAANQIFLVSDGEDLSTTELLQYTAAALGSLPRLLPVPQKLLEFSFRLLGKSNLARRLCGSLEVDITKTRKLLGWSPPVSVVDELNQTAEEFLEVIQKSKQQESKNL